MSAGPLYWDLSHGLVFLKVLYFPAGEETLVFKRHKWRLARKLNLSKKIHVGIGLVDKNQHVGV